MAEIRVFYTHIEIYPYKKGDCKEIERQLSKSVMVSYKRHIFKYDPVGFFIQNDILYLPSGVNAAQLEAWFNAEVHMVYEPDPYATIKKGRALLPPKSQIQSDAIDFLTSEGDFTYTGRYPQLGLNLDTGEGKTYAAICAVMKLKMRAIMITHRDGIREQWYDTILEKTSMDELQVCKISGLDTIDRILQGDIRADFYLASHASLYNYATVHGWHKIREFFIKAKIGVKIIDEAHLYFRDTLMLDFFSNTKKTFYLTATFGRGSGEHAVYRRAFASMVRYGEQSKDTTRKHVICVIVYFQSTSSRGYIPSLEGPRGFSIYKYIDYELDVSNGQLMDTIRYILAQTKNLEGKTLVTTPKIDSCERVCKWMNDIGYDTVSVNSTHKNKDNIDAKDSTYISSTIKSFGEGIDVQGLRTIINAEPMSGKIQAMQFIGRLREYDSEKNTYFYHLVDLSVPKSTVWLNRIMPAIREKCAKVITINAAIMKDA